MTRTIPQIVGPARTEELVTLYAFVLTADPSLTWERAYELAEVAVEAGSAYAVAAPGQVWRHASGQAVRIEDLTDDGDGEATVHVTDWPPASGEDSPIPCLIPLGDFAPAYRLIAWPIAPVGGGAR